MFFIIAFLCRDVECVDEVIRPWFSALDSYKNHHNQNKIQMPYRSCILLHYNDFDTRNVCKILLALKPKFVDVGASLFIEKSGKVGTDSHKNQLFGRIFHWIYTLQRHLCPQIPYITWIEIVLYIESFRQLNDLDDFVKFFSMGNCQAIDNCTDNKYNEIELVHMLGQLNKSEVTQFRVDKRYILINLKFETEAKKREFEQDILGQLCSLTTKNHTLSLEVTCIYTNDHRLNVTPETDDEVWCVSKHYHNKTKGNLFTQSYQRISLGFGYKNCIHQKILYNESYHIMNNWMTQEADKKFVEKTFKFKVKYLYQICLYNFTRISIHQLFIWHCPNSSYTKTSFICVLLRQKLGSEPYKYLIYLVPNSESICELKKYQINNPVCCYSDSIKFCDFLVKNTEQQLFYRYTNITRKSIDCSYFWDNYQERPSPNANAMHVYLLYNETNLTLITQKINSLVLETASGEGFENLECRFFVYELSIICSDYDNIWSNMINIRKTGPLDYQESSNCFILWLKFKNDEGYIEFTKVIYSLNYDYINAVYRKLHQKINDSVTPVFNPSAITVTQDATLTKLQKLIDRYDIYNFVCDRFEINYKLVIEIYYLSIEEDITLQQTPFNVFFCALYFDKISYRALFFHPLLHYRFFDILRSPLYMEYYKVISKIITDACDPTMYRDLPQKNILLVEKATPTSVDFHKKLLDKLVSFEYLLMDTLQ